MKLSRSQRGSLSDILRSWGPHQRQQFCLWSASVLQFYMRAEMSDGWGKKRGGALDHFPLRNYTCGRDAEDNVVEVRANRGSDHNIIIWTGTIKMKCLLRLYSQSLGVTATDLCWGLLKIYLIDPVLCITTQQLCNHYTVINQLLSKQVLCHLEKSGTRMYLELFSLIRWSP